jgi:hypothetical protein
MSRPATRIVASAVGWRLSSARPRIVAGNRAADEDGRMRRVLFALTIAAIALGGCTVGGASPTGSPHPTLTVAVPSASPTPTPAASPTAASSTALPTPTEALTMRPGSSRPTTDVTGTVGFDDIEGGCPYVQAADGLRYQVTYPDGWLVDRTTGAVTGPSGVRVELGQQITVRGTVMDDMASTCQIGPIFLATEVIAVGD